MYLTFLIMTVEHPNSDTSCECFVLFSNIPAAYISENIFKK